MRETLRDKIQEQWRTRDLFVSTNTSLAFYKTPLTDEYTTNTWMLNLLSSEAPGGGLESREGSLNELEELAREEFKRSRDALVKATLKLRDVLELLLSCTKKDIALTDLRFTAKTRLAHTQARQFFRYSPEFEKLESILGQGNKPCNCMKNLLAKLTAEPFDRSGIPIPETEEIHQYLERINEQVHAVTILSSALPTDEYQKHVTAFSKSVEDTNQNPLQDAAREAEENLRQLKCALAAREYCQQRLPDITFECDTAYAEALRVFLSSLPSN